MNHASKEESSSEKEGDEEKEVSRLNE